MEAEYWRWIQDNYVKLIEEVEADAMLPSLYQDGVLTDDEKERVQLTLTRKDKAEALLKILRYKPQSYAPFYKALSIKQAHLAALLGFPESLISVSSSQCVQESPSAFLKSNYTESQGFKTNFTEVRSMLKEAYQKEWIVPDLEKLVCETFNNVTITKDKVKKRRLDHFFFVNLKKQDNPGLSADQRKGISQVGDAGFQSPKLRCSFEKITGMETWDASKLCSWLKPLLEKENINVSILETIKKERITGKVFQKMSTSEMKDVFTDLPFGHRKQLEILRDETIQLSEDEQADLGRGDIGVETVSVQETQVSEQLNETLHQFDSLLKPTSYYRKQHLIRGKATRVTDLIEPVHKFISAQDITGTDLLRCIAENAIQFAAACLNSRTNGTIHFGIANHGDDGEILGISVDKDECLKEIDGALSRDVFRDQFDVAKYCIRPPRFVEVVQATVGEQLYVVEVDIVPHASLVNGDVFFLRVRPEKDSKRNTKLFIFDEGEIKELDVEEITKFMKLKDKLSATRKMKEEQYITLYNRERHSPDLREKFVNLLCGPSKTLESDFYPVLVCGKPDSNSHQLIDEDSFEFIRKLDWVVVMDLDDAKEENSLYKLFEGKRTTHALTTDDFDPRHSQNVDDTNRLDKLHEDLRNSLLPPWVFVNGYHPLDEEVYSPKDWKTKRSEGFKEALRFFYNEIPEDRTVVLIVLLSKETGVMTEVADEICSKFQEQWIILAEDETVADALKGELIRRSIDKDILEDRCVVGIPWKHVSMTISQLQGPTTDCECLLTTSTGASCELKEKVRSSLTDIDILGQFQCERTDFEQDVQGLEELQRKTEERFYKGDEVSWWNFWFKDHVCQRREHRELFTQVQRSLEGDLKETDKVGRVHLYHEPGAGGTTTSRNILWELHRNYRCCVLKQITDQTKAQLAKFRSYEDAENPKPVVVLIDNLEDDKVDELYAELEEFARQTARRHESGKPFRVFCVLLICYRRTKIPSECGKKRVLLRHELHAVELQWFKKKYDVLEKKHKEKKGVDPTSLISFNILKENFNPEYITRTVKVFLNDVKNPQEKKLLKYISLINTFDLNFQILPVASFDPLMTGSQRSGPRKLNQRWEIGLSSSIRVLLNQRTTGVGRKVQGLRIVNTLLSNEILARLLENGSMTSEKQTVGDAMLELLHSTVFKKNDNSKKQLMTIAKNLIKKRAWIKPGRMEKFSPVITNIMKHEDVDTAAEVMITVFAKTNDPMVAQQIARLYISSQNWKQAEKFAKTATNMRPNNPCVWDTYGQVYKEQVQALHNKRVDSPNDFSRPLNKEMIDTIDAAFEAIVIFRKEQAVSKHEMTMPVSSTAGYFGELQVIVLILDLLRFLAIFEQKEKLHTFLVDPEFVPAEALKCFGSERVQRLKTFCKDSYQAQTYLENELLQLKDGIAEDYRKPIRKMNKDRLVKLSENLHNYFGEISSDVPKNLTEETAAEFRRRIFRRLCGFSLGKILDVRDQDGGEDTLLTSQRLLLQNVHSRYAEPFDYKNLIGCSLALSIMPSSKSNCNIEQLIEWSQKLIQFVKDDANVMLEAYLLFVMINWPTGEAADEIRCTHGRLQTAITELRDVFYNRYPMQREGKPMKKKETTIFHLGKGAGLKKYAHFEELHGRQGYGLLRRGEIWTRPETARRLETLTGTLVNHGHDLRVELKSQTGNISKQNIRCSFPIQEKSLWNKPVHFFLGFSFSGPKAFGVSGEDPNRAIVCQRSIPIPPRQVTRQPHAMTVTLDALLKVHTDLNQIQSLKQGKRENLTREEMRLVHREGELRTYKLELLHHRNELFAEPPLPYMWN